MSNRFSNQTRENGFYKPEVLRQRTTTPLRSFIMAVKDPLVKFCYAGIVGTTILANYVEIPVYAHMMIMTMLIIYAGSALSVKDNAEKAEQV